MKKLYIDYILKPYDGLSGRETVEWSNLWWDCANSFSPKRYLLIGDSTIRMIRSTLSKEIGAPVDMIGSSSDLDDLLFVKLVDAFFASNQYNYDAVYIQLGHHAQKSKTGGNYHEEDFIRYKKNLQLLIEFISQYSSIIVLESIFDQVIVPNLIEKEFIRFRLKKEKKDYYVNQVTTQKSVIMQKIAKETPNCKWLDINGIMDKTNYIHKDHIHYEDSARKYIAHEMIKVL